MYFLFLAIDLTLAAVVVAGCLPVAWRVGCILCNRLTGYPRILTK